MRTDEAAAALGITTVRVIGLCRAGRLRAKLRGRQWEIDPASVAKRIRDKKRGRCGPGRPRGRAT